jgi:proton glutamate symport protein
LTALSMPPPLRLFLSLLAGLGAGILMASIRGALVEQVVATAEITGKLWLDGLRMTIVPLVFCLVVIGLASAGNAASSGRLSALTLGFFIALLAASATMSALVTPLLLRLWPPPLEAVQALRHASSAGTVAAPPPLRCFR